MIHKWQPWKQSTGARTEEGKSINKMNALKHGLYSAKDKSYLDSIRKLLST